jgi:hypothetical protein
MLLLLTIIIIFLFLAILKFILPILIRHSQLQKDYQNISLLPLSPIPFIGNIHQFDKRQHVFFELLCRMSKECQNQDKDVFCLWYALWPMVVLCSGKGLEVYTLSIFSSKSIFLCDFRHLLTIANNLSNHSIIVFSNPDLKLVYLLGILD